MTERLVDGHCHLDSRLGTCRQAMESLHREATAAGVDQVILLNLPGSNFGIQAGFENAEVMEHASRFGSFFRVFYGVNPLEPGAAKEAERARQDGAAGAKLHPRIHRYFVGSEECVEIVGLAGELDLPVMICGFPDGHNQKLGNTPIAYGRLADAAPKTRIALGHALGHLVIDAVMIAKSCPNLYLDLSFSLLYYRGSRIPEDIAYAVHSIRGQRVFWGTDYPDRPYAESAQSSLEMLGAFDLPPEWKTRTLCGNALDFLTGIP